MNIINKKTVYTSICALVLPFIQPAYAESGQAGTSTKIGVAPDFLNFDKFNVARECSPAEKYSGKTSCNVCDADTPNIRLAYNDKNSRITDAVLTRYNNLNPYMQDQYHNAWNQKTTTSGRVFNLTNRHYNTKDQQEDPIVVILHGYNLTGYAWGEKGENAQDDPTSLYPMNMRTKCETFRPKYTYSEAIKRGDNSGFRGAAVLTIGGVAMSAAAISKMTNPAGNKGAGIAMGAAAGSAASTVASTVMGDSIARRAFVCLEYHTKRGGLPDNGIGVGGKHIILNPTHAADCAAPLAAYYGTFTPELICAHGAPCDGVPDGVFAPTTRLQRFLFLMTNPSIMYGTTILESRKIAYTRPLVGVF